MKKQIVNLGTLLFLTAGSLMAAPQAASTNNPASTPTVSAAPTAPAAVPAAPAPAVTAPAPAASPAAAVASSNPANDGRPSLEAFQLVARRNIFDPNRRPYRAIPERPIAVLTQTMDFCGGQLKIGKGYDAFFVGAGVPGNGYLDVGDTNYALNLVVKKITSDEVTLADTKGTNVYVLKVMTGLERVDGGPFRTHYMSVNYGNPIARTEIAGGGGGGGQFSPRQDIVADDNSGDNGYNASQDDGTGGGGGGRGRRTRGGGGGGRGGRGGGGGGGGGGGFGNFGGNNGFTTTTTTPTAPVDPGVLERLRQRRAQENQ